MAATTIKDVAEKAGVSIGVVSKAFNNYPDVSEKTRQRILEIAKELNYSPNVVARNLSLKKQMTIGMITSGFLSGDEKDNNPFDLFRGVYTEVEEQEYELAIYLIDSLKQKEKSYTQFCRERNIGGAILQGIQTDDTYLKELLESDIPCVLVDIVTESKNKLIGSVSSDNIEASREIALHLLDNNHRDIVVVAGKEKTTVNTERLAGVQMAFRAYGLELLEENVIHANFSEEESYELISKYLQTHKPTAFLCFSDLTAFGVIHAIQDAGLKVPEDISVTGFDGIAISGYTQPKLTTIKQNFTEIGKQSAKLLHQLMENKATEKTIYVDHELMKRESVKKLPK